MRWIIEQGFYMFIVSVAVFLWCLIIYPGDYFTLAISWSIVYIIWMGQCGLYMILGILEINA
jgi:hypothetical protein